MRPRCSGAIRTMQGRPAGGPRAAAAGAGVVDQGRHAGGRPGGLGRGRIGQGAAAGRLDLDAGGPRGPPGSARPRRPGALAAAGRRPAARRRGRRPRTRSPRPRPGRLSRPMRPPRASASRRTMARPRPVLSAARRARTEPWAKGWKMRSRSAMATPGPVSRTLNLRPSPPGARPTVSSTPARVGELHGVAGEVEQDLPHPSLVGADLGQAGLRRPGDLQALGVGAGAKKLRDPLQQALQVGGDGGAARSRQIPAWPGPARR